MIKNSSFLPGYEFLKILGTGSTSLVMLVKRQKDNKLFTLKQINLQRFNQIEKDAVLTEIRILASFESPYIICYQDSFYVSETNSICIIMEYAQQGDLSAYIDKFTKYSSSDKEISQQFIWKTIIHILHGIKILHQNKVVHRDLKSSNILFSQGIAKIADFNTSRINEGNLYKTKTGTPYYTAPQIWRGELYTNKCDIWSFGCIIYEMCTLSHPFKSKNIPQLFVNVLKGQYQPLPCHYSQDLRGLIRMCLNVDPIERPSASQLLLNKILINKNTLKDCQLNEGEFSIVKPLKCPKINLYINDVLNKIEKKSERSIKNDRNTKFYAKKKCVQFRQSEKEIDILSEKKEPSIRIRKNNSYRSSQNRKASEESRNKKAQQFCKNNQNLLLKQKCIKSVKNIKTEQDRSVINGIKFRVKSCKKILLQNKYRNKQNDL